MDTTLELIDQLIKEHKLVGEKTKSLEKTVNDTTLISNLKQAKNEFLEGDGSPTVDLKRLDLMLEEINTWLGKHFSREETVLLPAVEKDGNDRLVTALNSLLFEHSDLRDRMVHSRKRVDELRDWSLPQNIWYARAGDLRAYLVHTTNLIETHAARENHFLKELQRHLKKHHKKKEK
ncbi:MAG: hemerythrin domain-containing protein [Dehalococcoidales bacterium]